MQITDKPATLGHIGKAMRSLSSVRTELHSLSWEDNKKLTIDIVTLLMSHPDEIFEAIYYINREEETLENIKNIDDFSDLEQPIAQLYENNSRNIDFLKRSFLQLTAEETKKTTKQ
jgi:predicted CopG family antitoxin